MAREGGGGGGGHEVKYTMYIKSYQVNFTCDLYLLEFSYTFLIFFPAKTYFTPADTKSRPHLQPKLTRYMNT